MATKKQPLSKKGKVAPKPAVKKAVKPAPKKAVAAKPVKKAAPAKKPLPKPAAKAAKPAPKPVKKAVKPVAKKEAPAKKTTKPVAKQVVAKKSSINTKAPAPKATVVAKPVNKAVKAAPIPMAKKEEPKKAAATTPKKAAEKVLVSADVKAKDIKVPVPKAVVIPKITTKTARKYEPDFTKSVLDKAEEKPLGPTLRYSDNELVEFKELIQRKLEAAKKELAYLQGLITRKDEMGGDEGDNRYMTMEDGSLSMEREQLSQMASRQITFIDHLEKAIMRIENKTYGICRVTGKLIDKARLRAVPHATLSIEAKMGKVS
jgi:RNA polymerase-binding transcription factor DksA